MDMPEPVEADLRQARRWPNQISLARYAVVLVTRSSRGEPKARVVGRARTLKDARRVFATSQREESRRGKQHLNACKWRLMETTSTREVDFQGEPL